MYKDKDRQKEANRLANKRYRERQSQGITDEGITPQGITPPNTIAEQVERDIHEPIGPLDIYSEERWSRLQAKGYVWHDGQARRPDGVIAVTVPGDLGYGGMVA